MREIIADLKSPAYNIAKWLIIEFRALGTMSSKYSLTNFHELIQKLQCIAAIGEDKVMTSFNVKALFRPETSKDC